MAGFGGFARWRRSWNLLRPFAAGFLLWALFCANAQAAGGQSDTVSPRGADAMVANVSVDGHVIVSVRGITGFPAQRRAAEIRGRIIDLAADDGFSPGDITLLE